ncbi:MAG TPA: hypothetical protein VL371_07010 [Gemmataceae bacterium]|nr:hypothetical protein [Gemmataceae bacterium]
MAAPAKRLTDVHGVSLFKSSKLSGLYVPHFIQPEEVIRVLNAAKISFTLVGAHGLGGWTQKPRATEDVDVVVVQRHVKKSVSALTAAFPNLEEDDKPVVVRLRDRESGAVAIDVMKPNQPVIHAALKHTRTVQSGRLTYKVPSLEMALALKFAPMVSLYRAELDKQQDAVDFGRMVLNNPELDLDKLSTLAELVYPGGSKEITELVRRVRAGEQIML